MDSSLDAQGIFRQATNEDSAMMSRPDVLGVKGAANHR